MKITAVRSEGIAHLSYFISSSGDAAVIDPRRDVDVYLKLALRDQADIKYIFETHRNEDYVIGSLELQHHVTSVEIGHSSVTDFKYGDNKLTDGDEFQIGNLEIQCIHTPGHTDDSMCYLVTDTATGFSPIVLFSGDTLFVNEVGRTDLVDINIHEEMSRKLYHSLHEKVLKLDDGIIVYPGHGAGSVCGEVIGEREFTTIGFERANNRWLQMGENEFVGVKVAQSMIRAPYFKTVEHLNTIGPPIIDKLPSPRVYDVDSFEEAIGRDEFVGIDTRESKPFVEAHIPRTISLTLSTMGQIAGWALEYGKEYLFVLDSQADLAEARGAMVRLGFDGVVGYLGVGMDGWIASGRKTSSIRALSIDELKKQIDQRKVILVDVRQPHETDASHIEPSVFAPLTSIREDMVSLDPKAHTATICGTGYRSTAAASILKRAGFEDVSVPLDGYHGWRKKGYPIE